MQKSVLENEILGPCSYFIEGFGLDSQKESKDYPHLVFKQAAPGGIIAPVNIWAPSTLRVSSTAKRPTEK